MKLWFKKLFVLIVAVMTLGFYVPPLNLEINAETESNETEPDNNTDHKAESLVYDTSVYIDEITDYQPDPVEVLIDQAKDHMIEKLGSRISVQIDRELKEQVLPNLEFVVAGLIENKGTDHAVDLTIVESQVSGYGEKVFDLYDEDQEQIIAKFHVRRENRPLDGYWFNFHYHLVEDGFEAHYGIAEVYWSKNTPPKWRS